MNKAYYWYRPHPYFGKFYPNRVLNPISDTNIFCKYFTDPVKIKLAKKYFSNGLSPHGLQTFLSCEMNDSRIEEVIAEIIFELVRQLHFPNASSRLTSLYASESIEQAEQWNQYWHKTFGSQYGQIPESLWEIEFKTNAKLYDAIFLDIIQDNTFSYLFGLDNAYKYWRGELSKNPLPELLIPYPVTIKRLIRIIDTC